MNPLARYMASQNPAPRPRIRRDIPWWVWPSLIGVLVTAVMILRGW